MNKIDIASAADRKNNLPKWMATMMACIFSLQWTFAMLPHTLIIRNISFVVGAVLGLYIISKNYRLLFQRNAIPVWLIIFLFAWMTVHLLFIGSNHALQLAEFESLWKRAALGTLFAIGFGISISLLNSDGNFGGNQSREWRIVVAGLCAPTIIYFIKYGATFLLPTIGLKAPIYLTLFYGSAEFYVAKIAYVFFCLPLLAIALGMLAENLKKSGAASTSDIRQRWFWLFAAMAVMGVFICENIKNGTIYSAVLITIFMVSVLKNGLYKLSKSNLKMIAVVCLAGVIFMAHNFRSNPSWGTLLADYEVASQISPDIVWKTQDPYYPENKYGVTVSITNFDRFFYATTGFHLLESRLMGYGLVQSSFGHLARDRWPNAPLIQSHSGWLDLVLGLGIPGVILLLLSSGLAIRNIAPYPKPWSTFGVWGLGSILLLYITTEVAQKNYVDTFAWFIVLAASLSFLPLNQAAKASN
ncbi:hypothetical protein DPM18_01655 [Polynucleobacter paneuropaeus]|uniref:hypothetical protein n=1 Tax=Polynucleobacter paneuropaeus TaxID=2527775 RepID=UPI000DBEFF0C|nr:hypothetical protein [Polynucleobacter paneuropaeus]AWW45630.1 hypothetical protein DPM18_01655 [Polynucleobacter paneuropaeus]